MLVADRCGGADFSGALPVTRGDDQPLPLQVAQAPRSITLIALVSSWSARSLTPCVRVLLNDAQESGGEGESVVCSSTAPSCSATRPSGRDAGGGGVKPRRGADAERHGLHDELLLGVCELGSSQGWAKPTPVAHGNRKAKSTTSRS
jgi:hypothetical protein